MPHPPTLGEFSGLVREWDSRPAIHFRKNLPPLTIKSLRDILREDGWDEAGIDSVEAWLNDGDAIDHDNVSEGIKRDTLTAMQLRIAPILDSFQDGIFRLPLDSQIAVLGPPGTGKTTTLVRRLRQKVDFAYLDPETERPLVEGPDAAGLSHADSWIMFTPTELLRLYVKEAFGKEGVPVHDDRIRTWDDHRREIGRRNLRILRTGTGGGLQLRADDSLLLDATLTDQITWFEAFNAHQKAGFVVLLNTEAERLRGASDPRAVALGRQIDEAIVRSGDKLLQLLSELAALWSGLREVAETRREETRVALRAPLLTFTRDRQGFLDALTEFVTALDSEDSDEDDGDQDGDDLDRGLSLRGRRLVEDAFIRAMRIRAIAQAGGRSPAAGSRSGRLLAWIMAQDLRLPDLKRTGEALLVQRAAIRLARAPNDYLGQIPRRYRQFRTAMRDQMAWYSDTKSRPQEAHPAEVDLIILAMLSAARAIESDRLLSQRLVDRMPPMLSEIARLRRDQVLVDEATDFSPVQLACMNALANPRTDSFFLSGDFNQRLTRWGSQSDDALMWVSPRLRIERISVTYRQSRTLANFSRAFGRLHGYALDDRPPADIDNVGVNPVIGVSLVTIEDEATWLSARIREINRFAGGEMPTIAVLVCDAAVLDPLAEALSLRLEDLNIRAVACPKGMVKGQAGDVRIFEVEHIKGLEFEAVFFMGLDDLHAREPEMFDRYVYVGATRAATFLGLATSGSSLPGRLANLDTSATLDRW